MVVQGSLEVQQGSLEAVEPFLDGWARDPVATVNDQGVKRISLSFELENSLISHLLAVGDVKEVQIIQVFSDQRNDLVVDTVTAA